MRKLRIALTALPITAALILAVGAPAEADDNEGAVCGQALTTSIVLSEDLTCTGVGFIIAANDIVVDLDGHTLTTTGISISDYRYSSDGAHSGFTLLNGTLSNNVRLYGSSTVELKDVRILGTLNLTFSSLTINGGEINKINMQAATRLTANGTTIGYLDSNESKRISITSCSVLRGLYFYESDYITLHDNVIKGGINISITNYLKSGSSAITDNDISGGNYGIYLNMAYWYTITGNNIHDNYVYGIELTTMQYATAISGNTISNNGAAGIYSRGFYTSTSYPTTFSENALSHNGWTYSGAADRLGNAINDGIHIVSNTYNRLPTVVNGNVTEENAAYGIFAEEGLATNPGDPNVSVNDTLGCSGVVCV